MPSRLREPFGKAGLIVAIVALVAALAGGAYAAQSDSSGDATASKNKRNHKKGKRNKKKQKGLTVAQVRRIAKQEARKFANSNPGPAGPQGPAGPAGPAGADGNDGANGQNGSDGSDGSDGKDGKNGSNGESVTVLSLADGECNNGEAGAKFIVGAEEAEACEGAEGPQGPEGNIKETLPPGIPIKGTWVAGPFTASGAGEPVFAHVSFNIPTSKAPTAYIMKEGENESPLLPEIPPSPPFHFCEGGVENPTVGTPAAVNPNGANLCLFTQSATNWELTRSAATYGVTGSRIVVPSGARKMGVVLKGESLGAGVSYAYGTWVVKTLPDS